MKVAHTELQRAADLLVEAARTGIPCRPVRELLPGAGADEGYAVQRINTDRWLAAGRRLVGRKIGLTSAAVQQQLGVDEPDFGMLFADMEICEGMQIAPGRVMQAKAEAEIAFVFERDLAHEQPTLVDLMRAVAFVVPAIEIVGSRVENWNIRLVDTVADNASSGFYVLGSSPRPLAGLDLRDCAMRMTRADEVVSTGRGDACLGHPLHATLWLARKMAEVGRPLRAGDVVLSGALGPMIVPRPGDLLEASVEGLGSVRAAFAAG